MKSILLGVVLAIFAMPFSAEASSAGWGYINTVYAVYNGAIIFNTTGTRTAAPTCQAASVPQRFTLDASTVAGQAQVAVLLNAKIQNKQVYVFGTGSCTIWGDTETVSSFQVQD